MGWGELHRTYEEAEQQAAERDERIRTLEEALRVLYTAVHDPGVTWEDERINAAIEKARRTLYPDTERQG